MCFSAQKAKKMSVQELENDLVWYKTDEMGQEFWAPEIEMVENELKERAEAGTYATT